MKTFREFLDNRKGTILEAGKNPVDIKWSKSKNRWDGVFVIDNVEFNIWVELNSDYCEHIDIWEFKFERNGSTKMYNDFKYPFAVVPTIKQAMVDVLESIKPSVIGFLANKDDKSRVKIYEKNAKIYSDKHDYLLLLDKSGSHVAFVLYNDYKLKDCAKEYKDAKD